MKSTGKMFLIIIGVLILLSGIGIVVQKVKNSVNEVASKPNAVDDFIGKTAVDRYLDIKEKQDTFNLPALKTSIVMYYTQNGRYPENMRQLEQSGDASSNITRDQYGNLYDLTIKNNVAIIRGAGKDEIENTTDDVQYKLSL